MAKIVFILGRPGSGKSRFARCITGKVLPGENEEPGYCLPIGWEAEHITDYKFLLALFQKEKLANPEPHEKRFEAIDYDGFRVRDFSILYEVLLMVNEAILPKIDEPNKLILVEFARDNYYSSQEIWKAFDPCVIEKASFLYIWADTATCITRVETRVKKPLSKKLREHDTFVPRDIIKGYYQGEGYPDLEALFGKDKVAFIDNNSDDKWEETWAGVKNFINQLCLEASLRPLTLPAA